MMNQVYEIAELYGILPGYYNVTGNYKTVPEDTIFYLLKALGYDPSRDSFEKTIEMKRFYPWLSVIEPVLIRTLQETSTVTYVTNLDIPFYLQVDEEKEKETLIGISIIDEFSRKVYESERVSITTKEERFINNKRYIKVNLDVPEKLSMGYYRVKLSIDVAGRYIKKDSLLIIAPDKAYIPPELEEKGCWGLYVNLYSIRSQRNWGAGDFGDLKNMISWLSSLGASLIGINPLHAIPNTIPFGISPYAPISRLYKNHIYIDTSGSELTVEEKDLIEEIKRQELIDYERISRLKLLALRKEFNRFLKDHYRKGTLLSEEFRKYIDNEAEDIQMFATYMVLSETFQIPDWRQWPVAYHDPQSKDVKEFMKEREEDTLFYKYIQWIIDSQHKELSELSREKGLLIGLYHDLAIGAVKGSFDVWANRDLYCLDVEIGAPPDDFSPDGQNWGLPPMRPEKLRERGYSLFIKTLRKNMQYCGALRIDHALGLFRQFWIPEGMKPSQGAYVIFPYEELLKIICLESVRNRTLIIAEDLGTVPENAREELKKHRTLSYRVFYFERKYPDPPFLEPSAYSELSLSAVTTHDLPTLSGFWKSVDIYDRDRLGKYPDEKIFKRQLEERERDKLLIITALKNEGLLPQDYKIPEDMTEELCLAIYAYLSKTPSKIVLVSLDDILGTLHQQNMPGTVDSYPNWRQKTPIALEEFINSLKFKKIAEVFKNRI